MGLCPIYNQICRATVMSANNGVVRLLFDQRRRRRCGGCISVCCEAATVISLQREELFKMGLAVESTVEGRVITEFK